MEHLQPNADSKEGKYLSELLEEDGRSRPKKSSYDFVLHQVPWSGII